MVPGGGLRHAVGAAGVVHGVYPLDWLHYRLDPAGAHGLRPVRPTTALMVLIGYILINGGVQNFYQPKVMGQRLKISPVVVFIGLFVWGFLLGGIGAILAVPLTLLVLIIMENFASARAPWRS